MSEPEGVAMESMRKEAQKWGDRKKKSMSDLQENTKWPYESEAREVKKKKVMMETFPCCQTQKAQ